MRPILAGLTVAMLAASGHTQDPAPPAPLAWFHFDQESRNDYAGRRYHWLGDAPLHLAIDVAADASCVLDLLWGSKNDLRGATVTVNGVAKELRAGGYDGYRWQRIELAADAATQGYRVRIEADATKAGFIAALRLCGADTPVDAELTRRGAANVRLLPPPPDQRDGWATALEEPDLDDFARAGIYGLQANDALRCCRRYLHGWLGKVDPVTGLIPQNLGSPIWNGRNSAADNYAFMVLTAALVEPALFRGRLREMLATERRLTTGSDGLPRPYDLRRHALAADHAGPDDAVFDGSEYVKDGLLPITEWLGDTPWSERMIELVDALLANSRVPTPGGPIPSTSVEVNGEMMQVLSRLCCRCDEDAYLDMACRIADWYLLGDHHPTRDAERLGLRDHDCELISGLTEVYAACRARRRAKADAYREPLHLMLDDILRVGTNEHGLMYQTVAPRTGRVLDATIHDNWGYDYNGFHTVWLLDGVERYRAATRKALTSLRPHYWQHPWQGWGADGIADAVEGAINLFAREPDVEGVAGWLDANIARMLRIQKPDGIVEGWHGDGNFARTALMWALWKQQGVTLQPWREDTAVGAVRHGDEIRIVVTAERDWDGTLVFDTPRHRRHMKLPLDYPRINQFPEWFTVEADGRYRVDGEAEPGAEQVARTEVGATLAAGLTVSVHGGVALRLTVAPTP